MKSIFSSSIFRLPFTDILLFTKQSRHLPVHIFGSLLQSPLYCLLLLRTQPIQVGEDNIVNVESPQQARQPLAPGERKLALGEAK